MGKPEVGASRVQTAINAEDAVGDPASIESISDYDYFEELDAETAGVETPSGYTRWFRKRQKDAAYAATLLAKGVEPKGID